MVQEQILKTIKSEKLKVYVVWTPVIVSDNRKAAVAAMQLIPDERAVHFWDPDRSLGLSYRRVVALPRGWRLAWDIYLAYDASGKWGDQPHKPADWMHQLGKDERRLDGAKLRASVEKLLEGVR